MEKDIYETVYTVDDEEPNCGRCDNINVPCSWCSENCGAEQAGMNLDAECGSEIASYFRERKELYLDRANIYGEVMREIEKVEAEYGKKGCALCYLGSPCEYQNEDVRIPDELTGWIPCSERLPEKDGRYITTNMYEGEKEEVFDLWYEDGEWFIDAGGLKTSRIVIAWMPLPSPYKPTTD